LPDGLGTELVEELREQTPYWGVPMVAVTSHSLPEESGPFLDAGFDAYVAKPFEQDELRTLVRHLVVDSDQAVDKGRKLVREEGAQRAAREEKSARDESRRDPPPTRQIDTADS
jgi:DNA-binding response OmpR family regulator